MKIRLSLLLTAFTLATSTVLMACSPCGALSNVTQNVNGTNLELTFTSNAGWNCCYNVQIEIVCATSNFTGIANYTSSQICFNGGTGPSTTNTLALPYPLTVIDLSGFCPGEYKWRAAETGCGIFTPTFNFTVSGASPIVLNASVVDDTICVADNTQLGALATGGCNNGTMSYSWSPSTGLSNPNIANPVAAPTTTTTYTVTATESGSCTAPQTQDITITVNPLPTASISGTTQICDGDDAPLVTLTGANATAPYTILYSINGVAQTAVVTSGNSATVTAPNTPPGSYTFELISVQDASNTQCSQNQIGDVNVLVYPLPVVNAGPEQVICEPNDFSPSEVTLNGSGAATYTWDNGVLDGVPFVPPVGTTTYTVTGTDVNGCTDTDQMTVTALTLPVANGLPDNLYGNAPIEVTFSNLSQDASNYSWNFGDGNTANTTTLTDVSNNYTSPGVYTVTLIASNGICMDSWTIDIEVIPPMVVDPTNIFTPNGDGSNDEYHLIVRYAEFFEAIILNRWGNYISSIDGVNDGWNGKTEGGKDVDDGVYFIKYKATDFNGKEIEGHTFFHLIR